MESKILNDCINSPLVDITGPLKEAIVTAVSEACKDLGIKLVTVIVESSYYICLLVGLSSIFLYYFGYKKGKNTPFVAIGVYLLIKIIGGAIIGH